MSQNTKIQVPIHPEIFDLIPEYIEHRKQDLLEITQAVSMRRFEIIDTITHNILGSARTYGLEILEEITQKLQTASKNGNVPEMLKLVERFEALLLSLEPFEKI